MTTVFQTRSPSNSRSRISARTQRAAHGPLGAPHPLGRLDHGELVQVAQPDHLLVIVTEPGQGALEPVHPVGGLGRAAWAR